MVGVEDGVNVGYRVGCLLDGISVGERVSPLDVGGAVWGAGFVVDTATIWKPAISCMSPKWIRFCKASLAHNGNCTVQITLPAANETEMSWNDTPVSWASAA